MTEALTLAAGFIAGWVLRGLVADTIMRLALKVFAHKAGQKAVRQALANYLTSLPTASNDKDDEQ